jgi:O-antigen ligase
MERLAFSSGLTTNTVDDLKPREAARGGTGAAEVAAEDARLERLDELSFKSLLAFIFVLFIRPQDILPVLDPLHLADVTGAFAAITLIAGRVGRGSNVSRVPFEMVAVLGLGGLMLATAPFSLWPGGSVAVFTDLFSKVIIIFALILNTVTTRARFERLISIVVLSTSYIAVRAVIDYQRGVNIVEGGRVQGVGGLFGNPNDMALNMIAFFPLAVALALRGDRARWLVRVLSMIGVPALAMAIIFTKSRGGAIGLVAMLMVLTYQIRRVRPSVALAVVVAALAAVPLLPESFTDRMSSIVNPDEDPTGSRQARKDLLREGFRAFRENPIVGLGAGQFQNYEPDKRSVPWRETHNAVLQVAAEMGIVGVAVFVTIILCGFAAGVQAGWALRRVRRSRRARGPDPYRDRREALELYSAAMVASLSGWLVAAMFASVAYYWTLYLVLALGVTLRDISRREAAHMARAAEEPPVAAAA